MLLAAASRVDPAAGTASVLVLVKGATAQPRQLRLVLEMSRTPRGWKATAVSETPVS